MELRPYQQQANDAVEANFDAGTMRQILCLPTGGGKTVIFTTLAAHYLKRRKKVLILTDRIELMQQTFQTFLHIDIHARIIQASDRQIRKSSLHIAMIETLYRRLNVGHNRHVLSLGGPIDLVIIDECHKGNFRKILRHEFFKQSRVLGVTATPLASSKKHPLNEDFETIVQPITLAELIEQGYLVPCRTFGAAEDVQMEKDSRGDYTEAAQRAYFKDRVGYKGVVEKYQRHAAGTKSLVFCIDQEHTRETCAEFQRAGIRAEYLVSGEDADRKGLLQTFQKTRDVQVLCNCGILTTGYDNPSVETIVLNRKTASLPLYFQMCGRGSRPFPGKSEFRIIDMFSNFMPPFGQWDAPRDWVDLFHNPPKPGKVPTKLCPQCGGRVPVSARICPMPIERADGSISACGYTWDEAEAVEKVLEQSQGFVEVPKELFRPSKPIAAMTVEELTDYAEAKGYKHMWVFHKIRTRGAEAVQAFARAKGYKPGWVAYQEHRLKEALWKEIKARYNGQSQAIGQQIKQRVEELHGDFFKVEQEVRRQYL